MAEAGFEATTTTSAGIAHAQGLPDGALGRDGMLEHAARIACAVPVPVTADLEDRYGARAEDVALTTAAAVEARLAGGNIEDSGVGGDPALTDTERACDRLRAAHEATPHGYPFVLSARTDPYLRGGDPEACFAEAVRRAGAYEAAGADWVFVPGPMDAATVGRRAAAIAAPLNVLGARTGREAALMVAYLGRLGVRRASVGGGLALAAMGFAREALAGMARGAFAFGRGAPTNAETDGLMVRLTPAGPPRSPACPSPEPRTRPGEGVASAHPRSARRAALFRPALDGGVPGDGRRKEGKGSLAPTAPLIREAEAAAQASARRSAAGPLGLRRAGVWPVAARPGRTAAASRRSANLC